MKWFYFPTDIYLFKVKNGNKKAICEIWSKLIIKTPKRGHWRNKVQNNGNRVWKKQNYFQSQYWLRFHNLSIIKTNHLFMDKKKRKPLEKDCVSRCIGTSRSKQSNKQKDSNHGFMKSWNKSFCNYTFFFYKQHFYKQR